MLVKTNAPDNISALSLSSSLRDFENRERIERLDLKKFVYDLEHCGNIVEKLSLTHFLSIVHSSFVMKEQVRSSRVVRYSDRDSEEKEREREKEEKNRGREGTSHSNL